MLQQAMGFNETWFFWPTALAKARSSQSIICRPVHVGQHLTYTTCVAEQWCDAELICDVQDIRGACFGITASSA